MSSHKLTGEQALRAALAVERLIPWTPQMKGLGSIRVLALEKDIHAELMKPWGDDDDPLERLRQKVIATCDNFVGNRFALRLVFKQTSKALGTAAMRILSPRPGARIMGGFLSNTVFVGTSVWPRDNLPFKHRPEQTAKAKITHRELNRVTAEALGSVPR
jgi:hypothetical protein